ncbi:MAG TPA: prepilin-type N-terminal cleavage/methylation domain-containing protein [Opitutales bacterium]|nr:prepilin-type N-terminal cleavage/methylation domain-containing protein [Opitutales bacterium]
MTSRKHTTTKGFTLIELLTVISIIGILAAILIPTIASALTTAKRMAASSNARSIAGSYQAYTTSGSNSRVIATPEQSSGNANNGVAKDINDVAFILAKNGLNDAALWYIKSDINLTGKSLPRLVIDSDIGSATAPSQSFVNTKPKSWAFVTGLPSGSPPTTTPLLWTYGLGSDGKWVNASPWEGKGGHVAYYDGHVEWVDGGLSTDQGGTYFVSYPTNSQGANKPTVNYKDAIFQKSKVVNEMGTE